MKGFQMRLMNLIVEYEQSLLNKIFALEAKIAAMTTDSAWRTEQSKIKANNVVQLLLNKVSAPEGLAFNGRDFQKDLVTLIAHVTDRREKGCQSLDDNGYKVPYIPNSGAMHMWLDKETGYQTLTALEVAERDKWVQALLTKFHQMI